MHAERSLTTVNGRRRRASKETRLFTNVERWTTSAKEYARQVCFEATMCGGQQVFVTMSKGPVLALQRQPTQQPMICKELPPVFNARV
jgi:hypothetical protein